MHFREMCKRVDYNYIKFVNKEIKLHNEFDIIIYNKHIFVSNTI